MIVHGIIEWDEFFGDFEADGGTGMTHQEHVYSFSSVNEQRQWPRLDQEIVLPAIAVGAAVPDGHLLAVALQWLPNRNLLTVWEYEGVVLSASLTGDDPSVD